jgi:hypothetical protein
LWRAIPFASGGPHSGSAFGLTGDIQAGSGGAKAALGVGIVGFAVVEAKATVARTWGRPWWADAERTYVGVELELGTAIGYWSVAGGAMWRVRGPVGKDVAATLQLVIQTRAFEMH